MSSPRQIIDQIADHSAGPATDQAADHTAGRSPDLTPDLDRPGAQLLTGPVGTVEILIDRPPAAPHGIVLVGHPQPLMGGNAKHKLPHYLARSLAGTGWLAIRPNFRGAGRSDGAHDHGDGETDDTLALVERIRSLRPDLPLALVGFSFGAFVMARVASALAARGQAPVRTCLAGMPAGVTKTARQFEPPRDLPNALVIHGERDDWVPLASVLEWARPESRPIVVVPGADHFFTGLLPVLRDLVLGHLRP